MGPAITSHGTDSTVLRTYTGEFSFEPDADLIERAVENFGLTNDVREAFYVLPDGRMLDGSGRHRGGDERSFTKQRQVDHRDIMKKKLLHQPLELYYELLFDHIRHSNS